MSADLFGAREQEKCRAPFSGEDLFRRGAPWPCTPRRYGSYDLRQTRRCILRREGFCSKGGGSLRILPSNKTPPFEAVWHFNAINGSVKNGQNELFGKKGRKCSDPFPV